MKLIVAYDSDVKARTKGRIYKGHRVCTSRADITQGLHGSLIKAKMNTEIDQFIALF